MQSSGIYIDPFANLIDLSYVQFEGLNNGLVSYSNTYLVNTTLATSLLYDQVTSTLRVNPNLTLETIKLTDGATNNYVLKSDADGNGSWQSISGLGVSSLRGNYFQIAVNGSYDSPQIGDCILSLPQSIATTSSVQFFKVQSNRIWPVDLSSSYLGSDILPWGSIFGYNIWTDIIQPLTTGAVSVDGDFIPVSDAVRSLGYETNKWLTGYIVDLNSFTINAQTSITTPLLTNTTGTITNLTSTTGTITNLTSDYITCNGTTDTYTLGVHNGNITNLTANNATIQSNNPLTVNDSSGNNLLSIDKTADQINLNSVNNPNNFTLNCYSSTTNVRNFIIESNASRIQFLNNTATPTSSYLYMKTLGGFYVANKTLNAILFSVDCTSTTSGNSTIGVGNSAAGTNYLDFQGDNTCTSYIRSRNSATPPTICNQIILKNNVATPTSAYQEFITTGFYRFKGTSIVLKDLANATGNDRYTFDCSNTSNSVFSMRQPSQNGNNYIRTYNNTNTITSETKVYQANSTSDSNMTFALSQGGTYKVVLVYEPTFLYPNTDNEFYLGKASKRWARVSSLDYYNGTGLMEATACMDLSGTTSKGFLPPKLSTAQKNAISSPATGLVVYDTDLNALNVYNGSSWINYIPTVIPDRAYYFNTPNFGNYTFVTGSYTIMSRMDSNTSDWQTAIGSPMFCLYKAPYAWSMNAVRCVAYRSASTPPSSTGIVYLDFRKNGTSFYTWTISSGWNDMRTLGSYEWDVVNSFSGSFASGDVYTIWVRHNLGASNWQLPLSIETNGSYT